MSTIKKEILVVGLGSMGLGIAQSLLRAGYKVYGQDKNPNQVQQFVNSGGIDTNILFDNLEAVIIVVLNEKQTREILFGKDGLAKKLKTNSLIMVCTTVSPNFAKEMEVLSNNERSFVFRCSYLWRIKKVCRGQTFIYDFWKKKSIRCG
jgi:3-hydroxyisobutyrate dehydrogenase-like beta-hydroxyacid dehydrogenase